MELHFETETFAYLSRVLYETQGQEETAEVIVPDSYPDVEQIIYTGAAAILRSKESRAGSLLLSGGIRAAALYAPEGDPWPRVLDAYLPFSLRIDHPAVTEALELRVCCRVRQADARMLNSRKILFRVNVSCTVEGYAPQTGEACELSDEPEELAILEQTYPLRLPHVMEEKSFLISDELALPASAEAIQRICLYDVCPVVNDQKVVGSRAVFKGDLRARFLFQTSTNELISAEQTIPYSQFLDLGEDCDEQELDVCLCVTGSEAELDLAAGKVMLSVSLVAQALVSCVRDLDVIEDAYAIGGALTPQWKTQSLCCTLDTRTATEPFRIQLEADAASSVLYTQVYPDTPAQSRTEAGLRIATPLRLQVLYLDREGIVRAVEGRIEVAVETALNEDAQCSAWVSVCDVMATPAGNTVEIRGTAVFDLAFYAPQTLRALCGGIIETAAVDGDRPAVILRAAPAAMSIWELAKQYGTGVETIQRANHLTADEVEAGKMLLIPM